MRTRKPSACLAAVLVTALLFGSTVFAQPPAVESGFVHVEDDVRLYYQRYGNGTPRLFIPNRNVMTQALMELLYFHDVVTWDARGRGLSDRPDDLSRYSFEREIADAEFLREHFGADQIVYVGNSLWGSVALIYAAMHPESLAGVVAISPLPIAAEYMGGEEYLPVHDVSALEVELAAMEEDGRAITDPYSYCVLSLRVGFAGSYVNLDNMSKFLAANECQYRNEHLDRILDVVFGSLIGNLGDWDWRQTLGAVEVPVLLFYSTRDWPTEGLREYTRVLPDVGWSEYDDAGHAIWDEDSSNVARMIREFTRGQWPAGLNR